MHNSGDAGEAITNESFCGEPLNSIVLLRLRIHRDYRDFVQLRNHDRVALTRLFSHIILLNAAINLTKDIKDKELVAYNDFYLKPFASILTLNHQIMNYSDCIYLL